MSNMCKCIRCNPIIAVKIATQIKQREMAIVHLSCNIIHCERVESYSAYEFKVDTLAKEIVTLQAQLEHRPQA